VRIRFDIGITKEARKWAYENGFPNVYTPGKY